jgi:hypothetical protein
MVIKAFNVNLIIDIYLIFILSYYISEKNVLLNCHHFNMLSLPFSLLNMGWYCNFHYEVTCY